MLFSKRTTTLKRNRPKRGICSGNVVWYMIVMILLGVVGYYNRMISGGRVSLGSGLGSKAMKKKKKEKSASDLDINNNVVQIGHWKDDSSENRLKVIGKPHRSAQLPPKKKKKETSELLSSSSVVIEEGRRKEEQQQCAIHSLSQLSKSQICPKADQDRYIVNPPSTIATTDGNKKEDTITLVCCNSSAGAFSIIVHENWAPLGSQRFLEMVRSNYFSSKVPFMRCISNFLCQFGIAGDTVTNKKYNRLSLKDDPQWLPSGPKNRVNKLGVKRFAKGFLAYAGAGPNTRGNQFIVALDNNGPLGGGSPWEVPWGEFIGEESFVTLDKIYTGYGEKGPSQPNLSKEGFSAKIQKQFPKLDYITSCVITDTIVPKHDTIPISQK